MINSDQVCTPQRTRSARCDIPFACSGTPHQRTGTGSEKEWSLQPPGCGATRVTGRGAAATLAATAAAAAYRWPSTKPKQHRSRTRMRRIAKGEWYNIGGNNEHRYNDWREVVEIAVSLFRFFRSPSFGFLLDFGAGEWKHKIKRRNQPSNSSVVWLLQVYSIPVGSLPFVPGTHWSPW